jgi:hypothetical protein
VRFLNHFLWLRTKLISLTLAPTLVCLLHTNNISDRLGWRRPRQPHQPPPSSRGTKAHPAGLYNRFPPNGLVLFVGTTLTDEDKEKRSRSTLIGFVVPLFFFSKNCIGLINYSQAIELAANALPNVRFVQEKKLTQEYFDKISPDTVFIIGNISNGALGLVGCIC